MLLGDNYISKYMTIGAVFIIIGVMLCNTGCLVSKEKEPEENIQVTVIEPEPITQDITLVAVGDCLMHNTQIWSGEQEDGTYNFDFFFTEVNDLIEQGDYSSICFEAPMAGPESGYTGYPLFNSPDAMAQTLKNAGFDLISTANNHIFDRGYQGAMRTLDILNNEGLDTIGTYISEEESKSFLIKDIKGIKVGYLAYSYGTNGMPVPAEHSYCFNWLDRDRVLADISALKPQVDILVLILHWGVEYMPEPEPEQVEMAYVFFNAGADVILGSHPHVIQPMEIIRINNQDKLVVYSLGNFISHQHGLERNSGIILNMKFNKNFHTGETRLVGVNYVPTYSHDYSDTGIRKFRVIPVEKTIDKIRGGREPYLKEQDIPVLEKVLELTKSQLGEDYIVGPDY